MVGLRSRTRILGCFRSRGLVAAVAALLVLSAGCGAKKRNPVPLDRMDEAEVPGMPGVRAWGGLIDPVFHEDLLTSVQQESEDDFLNLPDGRAVYSALLISGGGADGAFGAGFLSGWSESGSRPVFKMVTGISAGALIAPFAFVGSEYDDTLEEAFTTIRSRDVFRGKVFPRESLASSKPLVKLIARYVDAELLRKVAAAHRKGRRLYIGTGNLDHQTMTVWNMGRIAEYETPEAQDLFRRIMLASASIPVLLPPVLLEVEAGGGRYDEMHVDGGVFAQFFFMGATVDLLQVAREALPATSGRTGVVYVIRNGQIRPEPDQVKRGLGEITDRSVTSLIKANAAGDLYRVYSMTRDLDIEFHYVGIPQGFETEGKTVFDPEVMRREFDLGYSMATSDDPWETTPPGLPGMLTEKE